MFNEYMSMCGASSEPTNNNTKTLPTKMIVKKDVIVTNRLEYLTLMSRSYPETRSWMDSFEMYAGNATPMNGVESTVPIEYERDEFGRLQPQKSEARGLCLTRVNKRVRNWLIPDKMVDIDVVNAMPSILNEVAKKNGITCHGLSTFVGNYRTCMNELGCLVDNSKEVRSQLISGCGYKVRDDLPQWCKDVRRDAMMLAQQLRRVYPELYHKANERDEHNFETFGSKRRKMEDGEPEDTFVSNVNGLFLSYVYQREEGILLDAMDRSGIELGYWDDRVSMMYDGMLVYPLKTINLEKLCDEIAFKTRMNVQLTFKPIDDKVSWGVKDLPRRIVLNKNQHHSEAAKIMMINLEKKFIRDRQENDFVLSPDNLWVRSEKENKKVLFKYCDDLNFWKEKAKPMIKDEEEDGDDGVIGFGNQYNHVNSIVSSFLNLTPTSDVDDFAKQVVMGSVGKLAFKNGYWQFTAGAQGDSGVYGRFVRDGYFDTFYKIPYDFPERIQSDIDEVMERLVNPIFDNSESNTMEFFLAGLARAVAGHGDDKATYLIMGPRNSGKSLLFQLLDSTLGSYSANLPSSVLGGKTKTNDGYLDNSWMVSAEIARVLKSSELSGTSGNVFDGNRIKNMQSMKEGVKAREMYERSRVYYSVATAFFMFNDNPTFNPVDAADMCYFLEVKNEFVSVDDKNDPMMIDDPTKKIKDESLEGLVRSQKWMNAFMWIMLENYRPTRMTPPDHVTECRKLVTMGQGDDIYNQVFEVTRCSDDCVRFSDLKKSLEMAGCKDNQMAMSRNLKKMIENDFRENGNQIPDDFKYKSRSRGEDRDKWFYRYIRLRYEGDNSIAPSGLPVNFSSDQPYENRRGAYAAGFVPPRR